MSRFVVSARSTGAGSATLPAMSLYAAATQGFKLREVAVFNSTATGAAMQLVRLTTTGTVGAALTEGEFDEAFGPAPLCTGVNTHTVGPTLGQVLYTFPVGAAIGAGMILTFYDDPIVCQVGTANGIGVITTGTGQIVDVTFIWDE